MKKPEILRIIRLNFFKLLGALIGLLIAILFLTLGFWRTILIILLDCVELLHSEHIKTDLSDGLGQTELPDIPCIAVSGGGTAAGAWLDRGQKLMDVVDRFFPGSASDQDDELKF